MPIDPKEKEKIVEFLSKTRADLPCPACGKQTGNSATIDSFAMPSIRNKEPDWSVTFSVIPTTCEYCGLVSFFSAAAAGLS